MKTRVAIVMAALMVFVATGALAAAAKPQSTTAPSAAKPGMETKKEARAERAAAVPEAGKMAVSTKTETATISSIDPASRMVALKMPDGQVKSFKVGEEVKNLDQIKAGDTVRATTIDAVGVSVHKAGEAAAPGAEAGKTVTLTPKGAAKPGAIVSSTQELTGKITAIDPQTRMVSIQGPGGQIHEVEAGPRMNLSQVKQGDEVTLRHTQAMAINLEKAQG